MIAIGKQHRAHSRSARGLRRQVRSAGACPKKPHVNASRAIEAATLIRKVKGALRSHKAIQSNIT
jgi:hypothetical protein